jgi:Effector Associated Constant Component 1
VSHLPQLKVHIKPEREDDKQEIDNLSRNLQDDLLNLDVEDVHLLYEKPPPDSKAFDGVALGSMVVDFVSGGAIKEVTQTVQRWIERNENRSITLEMPDGEKIDVKGISAKDQGKIIDAWIMRQMQKMNAKNG